MSIPTLRTATIGHPPSRTVSVWDGEPDGMEGRLSALANTEDAARKAAVAAGYEVLEVFEKAGGWVVIVKTAEDISMPSAW